MEAELLLVRYTVELCNEIVMFKTHAKAWSSIIAVSS